MPNGKLFVIAKALGSGGYPEPTGTIDIAANGLVNVKDYAEANVQVPGGGEIEVIPLSVTANDTYTAPAGKAYSPVTVDVSGGSSTNILSGLSHPDSSLGSDGDIYLLYSEAYVKNSAGQFINTGYHGNSNSKYYIKFMLDEQQTGQYATPFGARSETGSVTNASYVNTSFNYNRNTTFVGWGSYQNQAFAFGDGAMVGKLVEMTLEAGLLKVSVDGVENTFTFTAPSITDTTPIGIFAMLINGSLPSFSPYMNGMKLFAFDIFESGTLIHSYRPALDANDVACIYDSIEQQYLYHGGGGTLQYGEAGTITATYLKVNGAWQSLIGSNIEDVS